MMSHYGYLYSRVLKRPPVRVFKAEFRINSVSLKMNLVVDFSFSFKAESVSVKIVDKFLFIEASESNGVKGVDCTKRFFKTCKKVDLTVPPEALKAFYRNGKIRIVDNPERKRGETQIVINIINAKPHAKKFEPITRKDCVTYDELMDGLRQMGMIV